MMTQPRTPRVKSLEIPWKVLVIRADPAFEVEKRRDPFYKFSRDREFNQNTARHGAYAPNENNMVIQRELGTPPLLNEDGSAYTRED